MWEDLHWADPSTLELLSLVLDQGPTARMLTLLTCRPEFQPALGHPLAPDPDHARSLGARPGREP